MDSPSYFLISSEGYGLSTPRACYPIRNVRIGENPHVVLCYIDPPIMGQQFGLGGKDVEFVLLASRHRGYSLSPVTEWPGYVHVMRIKTPPPHESEEYMKDQIAEIAWGEIYQGEEDAIRSVPPI